VVHQKRPAGGARLTLILLKPIQNFFALFLCKYTVITIYLVYQTNPMMPPITLIIAHNHYVFSAILQNILQSNAGGIEVLARVDNGRGLPEKAKELQPDFQNIYVNEGILYEKKNNQSKFLRRADKYIPIIYGTITGVKVSNFTPLSRTTKVSVKLCVVVAKLT